MRIRDTFNGYGLVTWSLHWLMAVAIVGVFALGLWMVGLDYYSPWYTTAPDIHRSLGMLLLFALALRFAWRLLAIKPSSAELKPAERRASQIVHWGFYPLLLALLVSGYLISTADGKAVSVFGWFEVPATLHGPGQEDAAGYIHFLLAWITMILAAVHTLAAIKHHVVDRSRILSRMWSGPFFKHPD
jgi:cytochrome b561